MRFCAPFRHAFDAYTPTAHSAAISRFACLSFFKMKNMALFFTKFITPLKNMQFTWNLCHDSMAGLRYLCGEEHIALVTRVQRIKDLPN